MWPWLSSAAFMFGQLYSHLYQRYSNVLDCANSSWWSWEVCFQNPLLTGLWVRGGQKRTQCQIWKAERGPQPPLWGDCHRQIRWHLDVPTDWSQLILKALVSHSDHPVIHSRPSLLLSRPPSGTVSFLELPFPQWALLPWVNSDWYTWSQREAYRKMIKSVGSGFRQPGVRIKKGNPHAIFNTMRATRLPSYRIVSNGSFRLALCLGHNFYLPFVDFLLDFHSPQAIVTPQSTEEF